MLSSSHFAACAPACQCSTQPHFLAGGWRNALVFDPLVKYGNFSYYDVMLRPIAQALNAVITPDTQVG